MKDGIFVSYSHQDSANVEQIITTLRDTSGMDVWFDQNLHGGENYFSVIANQIVENKYFVFIVSRHSIESDWCLRELEFAASERRQIIAIWLEDVPISPRIKLVIQNTHYINWYSAPTALFGQAVAMAFNGQATMLGAPVERDEVLPKNKKYFLTKTESKQLQTLLREEAEGKYAVCFQPENANLLGIAYELGLSVEPDTRKALLYYRASQYAGNPEGAFLYAALQFQNHPDQRDYLVDILQAAENGSVRALVFIGDCYYYGDQGTPMDKEQAFTYYEKAAKLGNAAAMYFIAYGYNKGEGVPQDRELAYMYALMSAEQGFPRAYRLLAYMYEGGNYLDQDYAQAMAMYDKAIHAGDLLSLCYQGFLYGKMDQPDKKLELYQQALAYAEAGEITSATPYYRMAVMYDEGKIIPKDYEQAVELYLKGAQKGHALSQKWAVPCINHFSGDQRVAYLKRAFESGCQGAAYALGEIETWKQDDDKAQLSIEAEAYFTSGAEAGDMQCVKALLLNYSWFIGKGKTNQDRLEAIKWFRFFFANADEQTLNNMRTLNSLTTYYYAYAIELDYDVGHHGVDREFVLYQLRKAFEESPLYVGTLIRFTTQGFLFPQESRSGLDVDIPHAEDLLALAQEYLDAYQQLLKKDSATFEQKWKDAIEPLQKGYRFIAQCYKTGTHVAKDKAKAEHYQQLAENVL